jgi:hypothetical protein
VTQETTVYSTYEVHVIDHFDDAEVIDNLPFELAYAMAAAKHGVVVERVHYELDGDTVPQPRRG